MRSLVDNCQVMISEKLVSDVVVTVLMKFLLPVIHPTPDKELDAAYLQTFGSAFWLRILLVKI